jgi:curved DNA-binding protein CbpA
MTAYELFGVPENAPLDEIRKSWKALMRQYHPDANPGVDSRIAVEINRAFDVLKVPESRAAYDAELARMRTPAPALVFGPVSGWGTTSTATSATVVFYT